MWSSLGGLVPFLIVLQLLSRFVRCLFVVGSLLVGWLLASGLRSGCKLKLDSNFLPSEAHGLFGVSSVRTLKTIN